MCKIGPDVMRLVEQEKFESLFIIMMIECPNEVRVELELAENTLSNLKQHRPEIVTKIEEMLAHKWIESEKAEEDLGGTALVDWILKYEKSSP
ncbi:ATP-dependent DNA ligase [Candidatus Scalindua japonica]|uniref:ATP-dependent DNA ligase n=2 Tax=Candidatus Scalindua japonica TaxID=1284222 RepID=A0A286TVU8_9BACT|nr:ATP-dependent DNA ligase [Candidatus Scalindua japonica]